MKRNRTAPIHFSPRDAIGDAHGYAGRRDVGPYHAPRHVRTRTPRAAHARHARTWSGATSSARRCPWDDIGDAHGHAGRRDVGPYHAPRHVRTRTPRATHARHVRTRTPCAHLVGRDVLGAPRPRNVHGTTSGTPTGARAAGDVGPYHVPHHTPMVGRDVLGAPLPMGRHRGRPRARGPPGTSAPITHRAMSVNARYTRTWSGTPSPMRGTERNAPVRYVT